MAANRATSANSHSYRLHKEETRFKRTKRPIAARPKDTNMVPLREAYRLLQHLPGYRSLTSTRIRIIQDKEIPYEKVGKKGEIWISASAVHEKVGTLTSRDILNETEDQKLVKYFAENESNTYLTAVANGIATSIEHAKRVYHEFYEAKNDPLILAVAAKQAQKEQLANPKPETRCKTCDRTELLAQQDEAQVVHAITGSHNVLSVAEEIALSEFQNFRCKECWHWKAHAPITQMQKLLLDAPPIPEPKLEHAKP